MTAPATYSPVISRATLDRLEHQVAIGELTVHQLYTKMRSLITNSEPQWQPMETVPMGGELILVLLPDRDQHGDEVQDRIQHARWRKNAKIVGDLFHFDKPAPIAWMYPPAIPASEIAE